MSKTRLMLAFLACFTPGLVNGVWLTGVWQLTPGELMAVDLVQFVVLPALVAFLLFRSPTSRASLPPLNWPGTPAAITSSLLIGAAIGASAWLVFHVVGALVDYPGDNSESGLSSIYPLFSRPEFAAIYLACTAAFAEEFTFRYLPLAVLAPAEVSNRGKWLAYLLASCGLFGAIHWENGLAGMVESGLWGFLLGFMFWVYRNPVTIVTAHLAGDLIYFWPRGF